MDETLFTRFQTACELQQSVDAATVERLCRQHFGAVTVREYGSLPAALAARDARAAMVTEVAGAAGAARAAMVTEVALAAGDAREALAAGDAREALAAWSARSAREAWSARSAREAWAARAAGSAWAARDTSYYAIGAVNGEANALIFLELLEAGCWLIFDVLGDTVGWVRLPVLRRDANGRLHAADGPAFRLPDQAEWFWHGVYVTEQIVLAPDTLTKEQIAKESNAQVRQVMVERLGIERVCQMFNATALDKRGTYELLVLDLGDGRKRPYLKMLNPSIGVWHVEGVHPNCKTVQQAINWRSGNENVEWQPEVLT